MFFKRHKPPASVPPQPATEEAAPPPPSPPPPPTLTSCAEDVARALRAFEQMAHATALSASREAEEEVIAAREKIEAATRIVNGGRLSYALLRQLVPTVLYWPSWSKRDDFEKHKNFQCDLVPATKTGPNDNGKGGTEVTVCFVYNGTRYTVSHINRGWSSVPDSMEQVGEASFYVDEECVLAIDCTLEAAEENDRWKFYAVRSLQLSEKWAQDLLQIASDIEVGRNLRLQRYSDDIAMNTAKNIHL